MIVKGIVASFLEEACSRPGVSEMDLPLKILGWELAIALGVAMAAALCGALYFGWLTIQSERDARDFRRKGL